MEVDTNVKMMADELGGEGVAVPGRVEATGEGDCRSSGQLLCLERFLSSPCVKCGKGFAGEADLTQHLKSHDGSGGEALAITQAVEAIEVEDEHDKEGLEIKKEGLETTAELGCPIWGQIYERRKTMEKIPHLGPLPEPQACLDPGVEGGEGPAPGLGGFSLKIFKCKACGVDIRGVMDLRLHLVPQLRVSGPALALLSAQPPPKVSQTDLAQSRFMANHL